MLTEVADDAQEDVLQEEGSLGTGGVVDQKGGVVEEIAHHKAPHQGEQYARQSHQEGGFATALELVDVGFHARGEHDHNDAHAGCGVEEVGLLDDPQHGRAQKKAGD